MRLQRGVNNTFWDIHAPECCKLQHSGAWMSQNAIIYITFEPHEADILLFARHSIRLLLVPSQYDAHNARGETKRAPTSGGERGF